MTITYDDSVVDYDSSSYSFDGAAPSAPALVQSAHTNLAASITATVTLNGVTAGDLLTMAVYTSNGAEVHSITDTQGGLWIRACQANASGSLDCEFWYASGVAGGNTTATVTLNMLSATDFTCVFCEWSGCSTVNAMDQEVPNAGTSLHMNTGASVQGFTTGELFISTANTLAASVTGIPIGWIGVTTGRSYDGFAYLIDSTQSMYNATWSTSGVQTWLTNTVSFCPPQVNAPALNPTYNNGWPFPQVQVEWSPTAAPFEPVWRNVARYVQNFKTTQGRQHQLDRIEAGSIDITFDGRDGTFNPWNTSSFLFNNFQGLQPMNVIRITAAWQGITYYVAYGYVQSITPTLADSQNVDVDVKCWDILQFLSLRYLSGTNYSTLVLSDSPVAYYRLGDGNFSTSAADSSGNGYTASLVNGVGGLPSFGAQGVLLYDANGALDLTNGTNIPNGGFQMVDNTSQPPAAHNPLNAASNWSFECWMEWTNSELPTLAGSVITQANGTLFSATSSAGEPISIQVGIAVETGSQAIPLPSIDASGGVLLSPGWVGAKWQANHTYATGSLICPSATPGLLWEMNTTSGNSGSSEPAWGSNVSTIVTDGAIQWIAISNYLSNTINGINVLDGNYHHIVLTYQNSTNTANIYVDSQLQSQGSFAVPSGNTPTGIIFGTNSSANGFAGTLDEVAIYNYVLTSTQVNNHYDQGIWFRSSGETGASVGGIGVSALGRLNHVLAVAGFSGTYGIGTPYLTPVYGEVNPITTTTALDYVQILMETEPGIIFQGQDGNIYALNRQYVTGHGGSFGIMNSAQAATSNGIFGDTAGSTYRFEYKGFDVGQDDLDIWNDIQAQSARSGNPAPALQEVNEETDTTGIAALSGGQYGVRTLQGLTSLGFLRDSDALAVAQQYLRWYAAGIQRAPQISIQNTAVQGVNIPQQLDRTLYDRITVQYQGQTAGGQFSQDSIIESIAHDVDVSTGIWRTDFACSPYEISLVQISSGGAGNPPSGALTSVNASPIVLGVWKFGSTGQLLL